MKELYTEGLATHGDPESCVGDPQGRSEAFTGARAGRAIEPRNQVDRDAHVVGMAEGKTAGGDIARRQWIPRGRRTMACTEPLCARTGRSHARPHDRSPRGPLQKGYGRNPEMNGHGKSDGRIGAPG